MEEIISNGDMIREMTDKGLARILMELYCQKHCKSMLCTLPCRTRVEHDTVEFLKSPAPAIGLSVSMSAAINLYINDANEVLERVQ